MYIDNTVTGSAHAATSHTQISSRLPSHISLSLSLSRARADRNGVSKGKQEDTRKESIRTQRRRRKWWWRTSRIHLLLYT